MSTQLAAVAGGDISLVSVEIKADKKLVFPFPVCEKCRKPVDRFRVKEEAKTFKFEAECHLGYEMWRVDKDAFENADNIEAGSAFKG